ncbi:hypothetical protein GCM10020258_08430 [Sphingomonas yabuuchiae]
MPTNWSVPAANAQAQDLTRWWRSFDDPLLAELVEQAVVANTDVVQAIARLRQARESLIQSRASLLPNVSGSTGYQRNENLRGGGRSFTLPDGTVVDTGGAAATASPWDCRPAIRSACSARSAARWRRPRRPMRARGSAMPPRC